MSLIYGKTRLKLKFLEATLLFEIIFNHKQNDYLGMYLAIRPQYLTMILWTKPTN